MLVLFLDMFHHVCHTVQLYINRLNCLFDDFLSVHSYSYSGYGTADASAYSQQPASAYGGTQAQVGKKIIL